MNGYRKCGACGKVRMMTQVLNGVITRICYACFKIQQYLPE